jgi:hypothetical protein
VNVLKGIGAILAGMIFIVISHTGTDFVLEKLGIFTPPNEGFHTTWMVVTATIYRCLYTVVGGFITAALAPVPRMPYVMMLGLIGLGTSTLAAIKTIPMGMAPAWYPIALAITALPCVWLGGLLHRAKQADR